MSVRHRSSIVASLLAAIAAPAAITGAQAPATPAAVAAPVPTEATSRHAAVDALLAKGDTVLALHRLMQLGLQGDAEAWYRRGDIASRRLPMPYARPESLGPDAIASGMLWLMVDESLRHAARLAPDSARYWLRLAQHQLWQRSGAIHHEGYASIDTALGAAHRTMGADGFGIVAFDAAMLFWRQWLLLDARPDKSLTQWDQEAIARDEQAPLPAVQRFHLARVPSGRLGSAELVQAAVLFKLASDSLVHVPLPRRRYYAALATLSAWEELRGVALQHARGAHGDFIDLMALGLARQRLADAPGADSAFAAARAAMPPEDVLRLTSIQRILPLAERAAFGIVQHEERKRVEERAWLLIDPLWRVPGNEIRNEYSARVAYAELRWGTGVPRTGAESDPGAVWVAFGPPTYARTIHVDTMDVARARALVEWGWAPDTRIHFDVAAGSVEERLPSGRRAELDLLVDTRGVNWRAVPGMRQLDTILVQSALFRAGRDSADLFVAARVPTNRLSGGAPVPIALDLFILTTDGQLVRRDSTRWRIDALQAREPAVRVWRSRLARESYLHRVEAYEPVEARGARGGSMPASLDDASFHLDGYGMSQVLVTQAVASRRADGAERWTDFNIVPNPGALSRNREVALLWEVYGDSLTSLERYRVTVTLQPPTPEVSRLLGVQARTGVIGGARRRVRERDRISVSYERQHREGAARVRVEQVGLGAVKVSPGTYVLRVDVRDEATGRITTSSRLVVVR